MATFAREHEISVSTVRAMCREVMQLLDGVTVQQVRVCGVEALRRWRRRYNRGTQWE